MEKGNFILSREEVNDLLTGSHVYPENILNLQNPVNFMDQVNKYSQKENISIIQAYETFEEVFYHFFGRPRYPGGYKSFERSTKTAQKTKARKQKQAAADPWAFV